jgi:hypothetical protein
LAAALAYYGMFSFVPLIFVAVTVADFFLEESLVNERVFARLEIIFGPEAIEFMRQMYNQIGQGSAGGSWLATLISLLAVLFIASGLFLQIKFALNKIWKAPPPKKAGPLGFIKTRGLLFLMVIGAGLLMVLITLVNLVVSWLATSSIRQLYSPGQPGGPNRAVCRLFCINLQVTTGCPNSLARRLDRCRDNNPPIFIGRCADWSIFPYQQRRISFPGCRSGGCDPDRFLLSCPNIPVGCSPHQGLFIDAWF